MLLRRDPAAEFLRFEFESTVANARPEFEFLEFEFLEFEFPKFDDPMPWLKKLRRRPPFEFPWRSDVLLRSERLNEPDDLVLDKLLELF
ncbi:MAG: hypothetical protein R3E58_06490 [Phycisphaerae bacterium]